MHSVYVYYKVPAACAASTRAVVADLFEAVHATTGIRGRLLRRRDEADTWMEVYEDIADDGAFDRALGAAVAASAFARAAGGAVRHTERFILLA
jgi:hypothetical protein